MKPIVTIEVIMGSRFRNDSLPGIQDETSSQKGLAALLLSIQDKQKLVSEKLYLVCTHEIADICLS